MLSRLATWTAAAWLAGGLPILAAGLSPQNLRCEARTDPLGVDVQVPRLGWQVVSDERSQIQSAYRVIVASTAEKLSQDQADLWDSGKVASDATFNVDYAGKPLASHERAYWKVKVWDREGAESAWSKPARWSAGMLRPEDWKADWIGFDRPRSEAVKPAAEFNNAQWIWHPKDDAPNKPRGFRLFLSTFEIPADALIEGATLIATADDAYKFTINGELVATGQSHTTASETDVARFLKPGINSIRVEVENTTESPAGLIARLVVDLDLDRTAELVTSASWKTLDDPGANWHNRDIDLSTLPAAVVVGNYGDAPWGKPAANRLLLTPPPYLRTEFGIPRSVKAATLYVSGLGLVDAYLNGQRVSDDSFTPGWTDYTKRALYRAYDVTDRLETGLNAIGCILADGWYSGYVGFGGQRDHYGKKPRARLQLHVVYDDDSSEDIATGADWNAATGGTREADFLMGEHYESQLEPEGWATAAFDDVNWSDVDVGAELSPVMQWHSGPPVVGYEEFRARAVTEPSPGVYILDLGRNFAGVPRLNLKNTKPGQVITLQFAERLNPNGTIYTTNYRGARSLDTYVCKGGETESWQPRFTFHGFQYIQVSGLESKPEADTVVGIALSSATPVVGSFQSSDPMLNQLHSNIYYTQRSNFIDIPTDCPQRDERLGWTGDAQVYVRTATLNTDVQAFFNKWLQDLTDGQRSDGQFPMIAPVKVAGDDGGPAWADAGTICPWTIYDVYNDKRLLERQYPSMVRFIEFCQKRSKGGLLPPDQYHCFGDWLSIKADTPTGVIYTAYYAYSTALTGKAAQVLGKTEDLQRFSKLYLDIRKAFQNAYVKPDGRIEGNTQACYVLALAFDLLEPDQAKKAAQYLVEDIESRDNHLSTGFIGTKDLMLVLAKIGRNDVAYRLLHNDTFPSWGFSIKQGATSIWERWDGWTPEKGFQDAGMNSFAHYSFGAVYQWMVENIAGIKNGGDAYHLVRIAPHPGGKLTSAETTYDSIRGPIRTAWRKGDGKLTLEVTIPANAKAVVELPTADSATVQESGKPLAQAVGVADATATAGRVGLTIGSGTYVFEMPFDEALRP